VTAHELRGGKTVHVIAEGRLLNIAAADGHPAEIMDLSFAVQFLSALHIVKHRDKMPARVIDVSESIDDAVARMRLKAWGISIDTLTREQREYLDSWDV
jgi:adenosylhomocysteinase